MPTEEEVDLSPQCVQEWHRLLEQLKSKDRLPALVFALSRCAFATRFSRSLVVCDLDRAHVESLAVVAMKVCRQLHESKVASKAGELEHEELCLKQVTS